jgi:hypothetical protein
VAGVALRGDDGFVTSHRTAILVGLTVVVLTVLAVVFARWFGRAHGWRRSASRLRSYVSGGFRDLAEPVAAWVRFRRGVRLVAGRLLDPDLAGSCDAAIRHAEAALEGGDGCRPYMVAVGSADVEVGIVGRTPGQPGQPWRVNSGGRWVLGRSADHLVPPAQQEDDRTVSGPRFAVGVTGDALVILELAALPAVGVIEGPEEACRRLAGTLAAQLAAGLTGSAPVSLVVADGILPGFAAPTLSDALDDLENDGYGDGTARSVLVCARPTPHEAEWIADLVEITPGLRVLVVGDYPGSRWRLVLDDSERLAAPELGFDVDAAPLERGVGQAVRRRREVPARVRVAVPMGDPSSPAGEASEPGPGATIPVARAGGLAELGLVEPEPRVDAPTEPDVAEHDVAELHLAEPAPQVGAPAKPDLAESDLAEPHLNEPHPAELDPIEPAPHVDTPTEPDLVVPHLAEPHLAEPHAAELDLAEPAPRDYADADMAPATSRASPTWPDPDRTRPSRE